MNSNAFAGQVAVVTGASRGIGRAVAQAFVDAGATTIITYASSRTKADEFCAEVRNKGGKISAYQVDAGDTSAVASFMDQVAKEFGGIDVLVNNAGIIKDALVLTMSPEDWHAVINTNLNGLFNAVKPVSRMMLKKRKGCIINISSFAALRPGRGHANYAASKGGIESFTKALAQEMGPKGIRVNAVAPGMIETDMSETVRGAAGEQIMDAIALRRFGKPEDIANAVLFLASDAASYITGEVLHVNGGM